MASFDYPLTIFVLMLFLITRRLERKTFQLINIQRCHLEDLASDYKQETKVRKLSASAVRRLCWCSCCKKAECSCCEKDWCSCCQKLVIARDRVCDRFLFEDAIVVIINDDKCIFISVCC